MAKYQVYDPRWWKGRVDGSEPGQLRWHQVVRGFDPQSFNQRGIAFLGFECDEGVRRNQGRPGAANGPERLQNALANFPAQGFPPLFDAGNVLCDDEHLEGAQKLLAHTVTAICRSGCFPVVLGGGHEVVWGHYRGLTEAYPDARIGIVNLDAHFDLRPLIDGQGHSGSSFYQVHRYCQENGRPFHYLALGIQRHANTPSLFQYAHAAGVQYLPDSEMEPARLNQVLEVLAGWTESVDLVYLTVCLDVFHAAYAPGVSAPNGAGLHPGPWMGRLMRALAGTGKLISMDVAELNPAYDIDDRTAKLGAWLIFEVLEALAQRRG